MVHPGLILKYFRELCEEMFGETLKLPQRNITEDEKIVASQLFKTFLKFVNEDQIYDFETLEYLQETDEENEEEEEINDEWQVPSTSKRRLSEIPEKSMEKAVNLYKENVRKYGGYHFTLQTYQHRGSKYLESLYDLPKWEKFLEEKGNQETKLEEIRMHLKINFDSARAKSLPVHDIDLRRWARQKAKLIGLSNFKASHSWISDFKKKYRISSRKSTKIISVSKIKKQKSDAEKIENFRKSVKEKLIEKNFEFSQLVNFDHVGVTQEMSSNRTLSYIGERQTILKVDSESHATHSHTIYPGIFADGTLFPKLLVCLQESTGDTFGPRVQQEIDAVTQSCPNLFVVCSQSGKMTVNLTKRWVDDCFIPEVRKMDKNILLLLDSWEPHWKPSVWENVAMIKQEIIRMKIPERSTAVAQPLDVAFNFYFKYFIKRLTNFVCLEELPIKLSTRINFLKMVSLIYNQFASPKFRNLIIYAFYKSGYLEEKPDNFQNVRDLCFTYEQDCNEIDCDKFSFIRCAHCEKCLCFDHFFTFNHSHY